MDLEYAPVDPDVSRTVMPSHVSTPDARLGICEPPGLYDHEHLRGNSRKAVGLSSPA